MPPNTSSSTAAQVTSGSSSSFMSGDLQIPTVSADVAADIAKYTNKVSYNRLLGDLMCEMRKGLRYWANFASYELNYGFVDLIFTG